MNEPRGERGRQGAAPLGGTWTRAVILESRLRFPEPLRRYTSSPNISEAQVSGEIREAEEVSLTWQRAEEELLFLRGMLPDGYAANGRNPFSVWKGELVVHLEGRFEEREG